MVSVLTWPHCGQVGTDSSTTARLAAPLLLPGGGIARVARRLAQRLGSYAQDRTVRGQLFHHESIAECVRTRADGLVPVSRMKARENAG
ncbi:MAG: hypothetical protein A3H93_17665 [Rhodocyclales bacterium RIFCSPLOWO2_02_FULL_63_24]|nr:MAG: hypothetical protein A3H93_17665 [Rhodocyclales bacterium RIFCSPLOWO2_02_FULL_63_24]